MGHHLKCLQPPPPPRFTAIRQREGKCSAEDLWLQTARALSAAPMGAAAMAVRGPWVPPRTWELLSVKDPQETLNPAAPAHSQPWVPAHPCPHIESPERD